MSNNKFFWHGRNYDRASVDNLVTFKDLKEKDPERLREISRLGGIASGETRRKKAFIQLLAINCLDLEIQTDELRREFKEFLRERKRKGKKRP